jgi:predicted MFS family arabinose efflux permease
MSCLTYALSGVLLSGIADRYPARQVLVVCDLVSALCVAGMALPATPLPLLFVLVAAQSMISPLFTGTRAASLTDILSGDAFILGRSLIRIVSQTSQIVGFGLGGVVLVWLSPRSVLCVTIATFLASATLLRLGTRHRPPRSTGGGAMLRQSLASAGQLLSHPRIRALLLMWWVPPMFFSVAEGISAPYAEAAGAGSIGFGIFLAAMPTGTVISELVAGSLLGPDVRDRIAVPLAAVSLLPLAAFAFHPPLPLALVLLVLSGLCAAYALGMDKWFVEEVPEELRGSAMSLLGAGIMTLQGIGMTVGGAIAERAPPYAVVGGSGMIGTLCVLGVLRSVRRTRVVVSAPAPGTPA